MSEMTLENKNFSWEANAVSAARVYNAQSEPREVATFVGESVLYATVFTSVTVI